MSQTWLSAGHQSRLISLLKQSLASFIARSHRRWPATSTHSTHRAPDQHHVAGLRRSFLPHHLTSCWEDFHSRFALWDILPRCLRLFQNAPPREIKMCPCWAIMDPAPELFVVAVTVSRRLGFRFRRIPPLWPACGSILSPEYTACAQPNSLLTSGTSTAPRRCRLFKKNAHPSAKRICFQIRFPPAQCVCYICKSWNIGLWISETYA